MYIANLDREIEALDKTSRALELRKGGATYASIASELGYTSAGGAHNAVSRALKKTLKEPANEVRILELERLDALLGAMWPHKNRPEMLDRILKIMERRAKLLGLDAPTKSEIGGADGNALEIFVRYADRADTTEAA